MTQSQMQSPAIALIANAGASPAMAFYNPEGLVPAWRSALAYAGEGGRVATLPDIIAARLGSNCKGRAPAWERYFTTSSAEYMGVGASGRRILIVAHGVGPMATIDGVLKAYSHEFKDRERNRRGGRISREEFLKLESGAYGQVSIVDIEEYNARYTYPFMEMMRLSKALAEPLMTARLGPQWKEYAERHAAEGMAYMVEISGKTKPQVDPFILELGDASNCSYTHCKLNDDEAFAHLISIGPLMHCSHSDNERERYESLISDVSLHEWNNGVRLAAVRGSAAPAQISKGLDDLDGLKVKYPELFLKPVSEPSEVGLRALVQVKEQWFTQYPKQGERMDTAAPEFAVVEKQEITGGPTVFTTTIGGYGGFFKYGIKEVEAIAPLGANAYSIDGDVGFGGKGHVVGISFYHVRIDNSKRFRLDSEVYNDVELLLKLVALSAK